MIISCPKCSTRLQLETVKLPSRPFTIKCPKCQNAISVSPSELPSDEASATSSAAPTRTGPLMAAPDDRPPLAESRMPKMPSELTSPPGPEPDLLKALASLLSSAVGQPGKSGNMGQARHRSMLVCFNSEEETMKVQAALQGHDYELLYVESYEQAIEMLQVSNQVDVLLLDQNYEEDDQGATAILRFISMLNPVHRRRLFVVLASSHHKTLDTQMAFNLGVNLLVNSTELAMLPLALNRGIREYNLLYRSFNEASSLSPF